MSPTRTKAKHLLAEAFRSCGKTRADLARATGLYPVQVDRALDPDHASTFDQLERIARAMGKRLCFGVVDA